LGVDMLRFDRVRFDSFGDRKVSEDKELRTKFHENVRRLFHDEFQSETKVQGDSRLIEVFCPEVRNGKVIKKMQNWPKAKPPYLQFVLYKEIGRLMWKSFYYHSQE